MSGLTVDICVVLASADNVEELDEAAVAARIAAGDTATLRDVHVLDGLHRDRSSGVEGLMNVRVSGLVVSNEVGAEYEGVVYDRFLKLRLDGGQELDVFDMGEPIAGDLAVGPRGSFVLAVAVPADVAVDKPASSGQVAICGGTVEELDWSAPKSGLGVTRPELYEQQWVVLGTDTGRLLFNPADLPPSVTVGSALSWTRARFDLYAIVG
jgi:hypothetical protein